MTPASVPRCPPSSSHRAPLCSKGMGVKGGETVELCLLSPERKTQALTPVPVKVTSLCSQAQMRCLAPLQEQGVGVGWRIQTQPWGERGRDGWAATSPASLRIPATPEAGRGGRGTRVALRPLAVGFWPPDLWAGPFCCLWCFVVATLGEQHPCRTLSRNARQPLAAGEFGSSFFLFF